MLPFYADLGDLPVSFCSKDGSHKFFFGGVVTRSSFVRIQTYQHLYSILAPIRKSPDMQRNGANASQNGGGLIGRGESAGRRCWACV